jgi:hypothetical protein
VPHEDGERRRSAEASEGIGTDDAAHPAVRAGEDAQSLEPHVGIAPHEVRRVLVCCEVEALSGDVPTRLHEAASAADVVALSPPRPDAA